MQNSKIENHSYYVHDMIGHDVCHEVIQPVICHDSCHEELSGNTEKLNKSDWFYLVSTLESWRVYNPRSVVKRNPVIAWKVMNLCKDPNVRVKGAYFTTCFRRECFKAELKAKLA